MITHLFLCIYEKGPILYGVQPWDSIIRWSSDRRAPHDVCAHMNNFGVGDVSLRNEVKKQRENMSWVQAKSDRIHRVLKICRFDQ